LGSANGLKLWIEAAKEAAANRNVLAIALANKLARIRTPKMGRSQPTGPPHSRGGQRLLCGGHLGRLIGSADQGTGGPTADS